VSILEESKVLRKVRPEHTFQAIDGKKIRSIIELACELDNMSHETYKHHVKDDRNDFSKWIKECIGDLELSDKLLGLKRKDDAQLHILKHIAKALR
jgi:hypothetical protein